VFEGEQNERISSGWQNDQRLSGRAFAWQRTRGAGPACVVGTDGAVSAGLRPARKTAATVEEAQALGAALDRDVERWRGDIAGAVQVLRQHEPTKLVDGRGKLALVGFSLGGAYALDLSVTLAEEIAAVVTFYASYPGLDYSGAQAAYLCHFAEEDSFEPAESVAQMEQELQAAGRPATFYTYPGTTHWFFEENRPEYDAQAARLAWERTIQFLHERLE